MSDKPLTYLEQIHEIAKHDIRTRHGYRHAKLFYMTWWSDFYRRPLKDPLLEKYSLEELAYEYYLHSERVLYERDVHEDEADRIEDEKWDAAEAWADEMERLDQETAQPEETPEDAPQPEEYNPLEDPKNIEWMEEQIQKNKLMFGDDFGEDLNLDFEDS